MKAAKGGVGHAYPEPTVRFYGEREAGWKALSVAQAVSLRVPEFTEAWRIVDGEPTGTQQALTTSAFAELHKRRKEKSEAPFGF